MVLKNAFDVFVSWSCLEVIQTEVRVHFRAANEVWRDFISRSLMEAFLVQKNQKSSIFLRKEVIQPQVPLRLPCYDLVPIREFILGACALAVRSAT